LLAAVSSRRVAVLYFGVAAVVLVWACGFSIIFRRCMKRRRQERQTAADEGTPQQSTQQQGQWQFKH
jgi:ABC-type nickel/cobalt efflux system permease component RcnA